MKEGNGSLKINVLPLFITEFLKWSFHKGTVWVWQQRPCYAALWNMYWQYGALTSKLLLGIDYKTAQRNILEESK